MAAQFSLLDHQLAAPHNGTPTSVAAAINAGPTFGTKKARILQWIGYCEDGITQDELSIALFLPRSTICSLTNSLMREGRIRKLDGVTRTSQYGGECAVYVLEHTPASRNVADVTTTGSGV